MRGCEVQKGHARQKDQIFNGVEKHSAFSPARSIVLRGALS
jgi:hypothetical protein